MIRMLPEAVLLDAVSEHQEEAEKPRQCQHCRAFLAPVIAQGAIRYICFACDDDPSAIPD